MESYDKWGQSYIHWIAPYHKIDIVEEHDRV